MKKLFTSVVLAAMMCTSAFSQEAFKHLSLGIEAGTGGIGVELALPVVTDHLVIAAGATFPNFKSNSVTNYDISSFSGKVNEYVVNANEYISRTYAGATLLTPLPNNTPISAAIKVNLVSFKALLEYYPSKKSGFHITGGVYAGNDYLIGFDGTASELWSIYAADKNIAANYPDMQAYLGEIPDLTANINGKSYKITEPGNINLGVSVSKVRPYFGIGFGKSVPDTRCGFQFDLGAVYLGKVGITSTNEVPYQPASVELTLGNETITNIVNGVAGALFYPIVNFRFILRLF